MNQGSTLPAAPAGRVARARAGVFPILELIVLCLLLAAGWRMRHAYPSIPMADADSWGYMNPALTWMSGLGFQQTDGRDWFYPMLVMLFLKTTGSFAGIVWWQKWLGVLSGVFMALTWRGWVSTLHFKSRARLLVSLLGAAPILFLLINPQNVYFEMKIRPEAVLPVFVYAQLACLMGFCRYRWGNAKASGEMRREADDTVPQVIRIVVLGAAAVFLAYACFLLKPSWLLAFAATSAPVFFGMIGRGVSARARVLAPCAGILVSLLALWLPPKFFFVKDSQSRTFLPSTLFTIHARMIDHSLQAKLAKLADADPDKARLQVFVAELEKEIRAAEHAPDVYEKLGFDPDYLYYHSPLLAAVYRYTGQDDEKFRAFCMSSFKDAVIHDPAGFVHKVLLQFTYFLFPEPRIFFKDRLALARSYKSCFEVLKPSLDASYRNDVREMYRQYLAEITEQAADVSEPGGNSKLRGFSEAVAPWALTVEIVFLVCLAGSFVWEPLREMRLGGCVALLLFMAPMGNAATVCVVHALDIARYRFTYGSYLFFALAAMGVFAGVVFVQVGVYLKGRFGVGRRR